MVKPAIAFLIVLVAATACTSVSRRAESERAKEVAGAYLAQHRVPLPPHYRLTVAYCPVEPASALRFPTYGVDFRRQGEKTILYSVAVDPRSWKAVSFMNNSGIKMPWMYDEPVYETL